VEHGVLISGASTGIGRACALDLANRGVRVFAGVRQLPAGEALRAEAAGTIVPIVLDVTSADGIAAAIDAVAHENGARTLSGLVNNAGIAVGGPLEFVPIAAVRAQFEANVLGMLALTQACLPLLRAGRGRIVNISSISGRVATPLLGPYAASKFAVEGLSDTLRRELAAWGITVSLVEPGKVVTPLWAKSVSAAEAMLDDLPSDARALYGPAIERSKQRALRAARTGIPAADVATTVWSALTARRPRIRYLVGRDAKIGALLTALLPDRVLDWYLRRARAVAARPRA
jgi:NAD(P)-dependent dehydrogenase (short-subunit alcohol dehydrogenase family)